MSKHPAPKQHGATAEYKTFAINNRRYLGNKYKLLPFISRVVDEECPGVESVADIFAGTGAVASAFLKKQVFTNDLLYSNYICNLAWFGSQSYSKKKLVEYIGYYNTVAPTGENYMTVNFSNTFFSRADCAKIGFIREDIEEKFRLKKLNQRERALLITALLYAMDKIANTCGHYDAYIQGAQYDKPLELSVPMAEEHNQTGNKCYNTDANKLVRRLKADLVYIDPPYNSRQYSDAYHVLENVARWEKPEVHGVARKMDRTALKSDYCTQKATDAFEDLIQHIDAKYILFSYNNMATKGNDRSNAKITDEDIVRILGAKGQVSVFSSNYKAFSAGKSDIQENAERLFLCKCAPQKPLFASPLNYTGGKYKLLPQLLPRFPRKIGTFVDLFCGGGNVGLNAECERVVLNDINPSLSGLYETFRRLGTENTLAMVDRTIVQYRLSQSEVNGYPCYGCTTSTGLGSYNRVPYEALRAAFNSRKEKDEAYYIQLYVLIVFAFNNQIRFNSKGEFNLPVGKRDFNPSMRKKLSAFIDALALGDFTFSCQDFRAFDVSKLTGEDFVYLDPPYLITCATYNENGGWGEKDEGDLLAFLDKLHERHIPFALSNVLRSKGKKNAPLLAWLERNRDKYRAIPLRYSYSNSNYQTKDKTSSAEEVLIVNYKEV